MGNTGLACFPCRLLFTQRIAVRYERPRISDRHRGFSPRSVWSQVSRFFVKDQGVAHGQSDPVLSVRDGLLERRLAQHWHNENRR